MRFSWLTADYRPAAPGEEKRFGFECPKGNGMCEGLIIRGRGLDAPKKTWIWNGDRDKPTFSPSIDCRVDGKPCAHGFIENGVWRDP